jgi:hypothetical protein
VATLQIRRWTERDFTAARNEWNKLVSVSGADRFFLSHEWLSQWWRHFARDHAELMVLAAYHDDELVGIAPFMLTRVRRGPLYFRSVQLLGGSLDYSDLYGAMSEYLDVVAIAEVADEFRAAIVGRLFRETDFVEFGISYCDKYPAWSRALAQHTGQRCTYLRDTVIERSYQADLSKGFSAYAAQLSSSTRRKLLHRRKLLLQLGTVRFENVPVHDNARAFAELNELHATRWGTPIYSPRMLRFHSDLAAGGAQLWRAQLSRLWLGDRLISVLYDVVLGDRQYNLQMGFDERLDRRLSVGLLHLGWAMQSAAESGIIAYDLLAGRGKKTQYKSHLAQQNRELQSVWLLRGCSISTAAKVSDYLRRKFRTTVFSPDTEVS